MLQTTNQYMYITILYLHSVWLARHCVPWLARRSFHPKYIPINYISIDDVPQKIGIKDLQPKIRSSIVFPRSSAPHKKNLPHRRCSDFPTEKNHQNHPPGTARCQGSGCPVAWAISSPPGRWRRPLESGG